MVRPSLVLLLSIVCLTSGSDAAPVVLRSDIGGLGAALDGISSAPSASISVPGFGGLTITVTALSSDPGIVELNSTGTSLGINSTGTDDTDQFDALLNELVTFQFNQAVTFNSLDFVGFGSSEVFSFGGILIAGTDPNLSSSVYTFPTPLVVSAGSPVTLQATTGVVGIEGFDITAVPEPSSLALCIATGSVFLARRRRLLS